MAKQKVTIEDLAGMVKRGFDGVDKKFHEIDEKLNVLATGQEEIKLRLDNVAYRFELVELQKRVELLEQKVLHKAIAR